MGMFPEIQVLYMDMYIYIYMAGTSNQSVPEMVIDLWRIY